jgi:hypothetical protein
MRALQTLPAILLILSAAPAVHAQNDGAILLFSDSEYDECYLVDVAIGQHEVYMVHVDYDGVRGSDFGISQFEGGGLTYVSESIPWSSVGTVAQGVSVLYGGDCVVGTVFVGTVVYSGNGTSPPCSYLKPRPSGMDRPAAIAINCQNEIVLPLEGRLYVNPDPTCPCDATVPTEGTSWGRLKALYR